MIIETLSTFPGMYDSVMNSSMMRIAQEKGILDFHAYDLRDWTHDRHRTTDDDPYGGGAGLVMKCEPLFEAYDEICARGPLLSGDWRERDAVQSLGSPARAEVPEGTSGSCGTRFVDAAQSARSGQEPKSRPSPLEQISSYASKSGSHFITSPAPPP